MTTVFFKVDKSVLDMIAAGDPNADQKSFLKFWCEWETLTVTTSATKGTYLYIIIAKHDWLYSDNKILYKAFRKCE